MIWKAFAAGLLAGVCMVPVMACVDPMSVYSAGIVFSDGEVITTGNIGHYSQDSLAYIKTCEIADGEKGQPYKIGDVQGKPADLLTIDSVGITGNTLSVNVKYGGGCKDHSIELYTSGELYITLPGQMDLYLTHDDNGDDCKAMVSGTLQFNLTGLHENGEVRLNLYAPGATTPFSTTVLWNPVSGAKANLCSYKMRSAWSEKAMAYIGPYAGLFNDGEKGYSQLLLIFDTSSVPSNAAKSAAVIAELERLVQMNVISMPQARLDHIGSFFSNSTANVAQYWTKEDTMLGFNQWMDGGTVNGVRSVYTTKGCGSGITYQLPEKVLVPTPVVAAHDRVVKTGRAISAYGTGGGIAVTFDPVYGTASFLAMTDLRGRLVASVSLAPGTGKNILKPRIANGLPAGCYLISIISNGRILQTGKISLSGN